MIEKDHVYEDEDPSLKRTNYSEHEFGYSSLEEKKCIFSKYITL